MDDSVRQELVRKITENINISKTEDKPGGLSLCYLIGDHLKPSEIVFLGSLGSDSIYIATVGGKLAIAVFKR